MELPRFIIWRRPRHNGALPSASAAFLGPGHDIFPQNLLTQADELFYRATKAGRNGVEFAEFCRAKVSL
jgi:hypothetical protein